MNQRTSIDFSGVSLLVLSACSTGFASQGSGIEVEGLCALAKIKGARAVVASLWNVDDEATAEFMETFFLHLREPGAAVATALRQAQTDMIRSETKYALPFYWAPFFSMDGENR